MTVSNIKVGQVVEWSHIVSNYGHIDIVIVKVLKIGAKRITIEVPRMGGGTRKTSVTPSRLYDMRKLTDAEYQDASLQVREWLRAENP